VAAVHHQAGKKALGLQLGLGLLDASGIVVGSLLTTAQNHEAVGVADGANNRHDTGLGN